MEVDSTEHQICLLLRLHFKAGEIANMLGVTPPYISKTSTEILENLYGKKGSSKELYKELGKLY
jgi:predicted transcriptional regulator